MDSDDKIPIDELLTVSKGGSESDPPSKGGPKSGPPSEINYQRSTIYINITQAFALNLRVQREVAYYRLISL